MISYNRSVTAMCLKIRDRLKVKFLFYDRWEIALIVNRHCITVFGWMWIISMVVC